MNVQITSNVFDVIALNSEIGTLLKLQKFCFLKVCPVTYIQLVGIFLLLFYPITTGHSSKRQVGFFPIKTH